MKFSLIVCWYNEEQIHEWLIQWGMSSYADQPDWLILQQDKNKEGCAVTKNRGIIEALHRESDVVIILDDDCYTTTGWGDVPTETLEDFCNKHLAALEPQPVELYEAVTDPPSRGTPYFNRTVTLPVAASAGFWSDIPDRDAASQLVQGATASMKFHKKTMFWRWFPLSGMNVAFRSEFWPHFRFDEECPRMDDVFMGYRLQKVCYDRGHCINLNGPMVRHARQSNVWKNLRTEAEFMERAETEWQKYTP